MSHRTGAAARILQLGKREVVVQAEIFQASNRNIAVTPEFSQKIIPVIGMSACAAGRYAAVFPARLSNFSVI